MTGTLDFQVDIGPGTERRYPVRVRSAGAGEASGVLQLPSAPDELAATMHDLEMALLRSGQRRRTFVPADQRV